MLHPEFQRSDRRAFLGALSASLFLTPGLFAEQLLITPRMTEGPFYPDKLPLDTDNDLIIVNNSLTPAVGEITHLTGRVLDLSGSPIKDATVEIWQCDANEVYLHSSDSGPKAKQRDKNFQGFGRFSTSSKGEYRFRTIKPVPYPGRPAPHIHFKVKKGNRELITTQLMVRGHAGNARDGIFSDLRDPIDRELVLGDFKRVPESKVGEWAVKFDIIVGRTPDENSSDRKR
ncbi:intradiol ring-cleavage dioxygenase [Telmatocola sphagniphila]|jgi:protocatechuate 3,4-dioxygenase beta subunit|uniref:Intradiol ring-cleavage dioxygenase n=1 Tax=Telmatocola sphagniphila TaxID=1123043 RepID=A0A8E6EX59_9BACT|nr:protocatechuate 3,4-dioxygenase [Telmatocola sphagniphila]QVL30911.1 intradiol ring-cleavage dioxygenase [Telmatocola sphagniphila]